MGRYLAVVGVIIVAGLVVFSGDDKGSGITEASLPSAQLDEDTLITTISHGEQVDIEDHLVEGQWTVVEFMAEW